MNGRREREIVRRLEERGDVDPPADLLERIQAEIPAAVKVGLEAPRGREAESRPPARQRWLLAASLVAMIGAGLFSLHLYEGDRERLGAPARSEAAPSALEERKPEAGPGEQQQRSSPSAPMARLAPKADLAPAPKKPRPVPQAVSPRAEGEATGPEGAAGGVAGGVAAPPEETNTPQPVQPLSLPNEQADAAAAPPPVAAEAPELAQVEAPAAPPAEMMMSKTERSLVAQPARRFVDAAASPRDSFRPRPGFGAEAKERRAGNLANAVAPSAPAAEGAPSPFGAGERRRLVLFRLSGAAHSGQEVEVTFDPTAVARWRRVSAGAAVLYEVELQPGASPETPVATLRGGVRLRVADLASAWEQTSPGFRLASLEMELAAVGEGGRPRSDLPELLRRARALAAEIPDDRRAADLVRRIERLSP